MWQTFTGGSVVVVTDAPAEAIICAPALLGDDYGEEEFIVDRRRLRSVRVVTRHPQISIDEHIRRQTKSAEESSDGT
jgi:hypothetical protein